MTLSQLLNLSGGPLLYLKNLPKSYLKDCWEDQWMTDVKRLATARHTGRICAFSKYLLAPTLS